jgi:hypothetical protein
MLVLEGEQGRRLCAIERALLDQAPEAVKPTLRLVLVESGSVAASP